MSTVRGRCIHIQTSSKPWTVEIQNQFGQVQVEVTDIGQIETGDWIEVTQQSARVLTPNRTADRSLHWMGWVLDPQRLQGTAVRHQVEGLIREFFLQRGFIETRTPLLVPCPGMETHIRPFSLSTGAYLPTSPEFAMKRLLAGGLERIFQICPSFRHEPNSRTHHPEFTMLEWYRAYCGYEEIMSDTEHLFEFIALRCFGKPSFKFQGQEISVKTPWPRLKVRDLFSEIAGVDLANNQNLEDLQKHCARLNLNHSPNETWDDLYFKIWLNLVEPKLPQNQAVFVYRYPPSQAALAVVDQDPDGTPWAKRFELYAGGLELGNAFEELTDPIEQRARFVKDMLLRKQIYGPAFPANPVDEEFLNALSEGMPPSGGIAIGVDRMVMLFADQPDIQKTLWLSSYSGTETPVK